MAITVHVPGVLRSTCGGVSRFTLSAPTVRVALEQVETSHPSLHRNICDETGAVRRHINLFVNTTHIRDLAGLDTVLSPGDEVLVVPAVSGG